VDVAAYGPGERAALIPWFVPAAGSLRVLSETVPTPWRALRADPGVVCCWLARTQKTLEQLSAERLQEAKAPWVDWLSEATAPIYRTSLVSARFAELLADYVHHNDREAAWVAGMLPFLPWLAVAAVDPKAATTCRVHPEFPEHPNNIEVGVWGMTAVEIGTQLAQQWSMPTTFRRLLGHFTLAPADVAAIGGDRTLHAIAQLAVLLAEQHETRLHVADQFDLAASLRELRLRTDDLDLIRARFASEYHPIELCPTVWEDPRPKVTHPTPPPPPPPTPPPPPESEDEDEEFPEDRLRDLKLEAMAELSAGASHEINTPLAVISGHGQYLLKNETDEARRKALHSIVRQTEKIHSILADLMHYARPGVTKFQPLELNQLLQQTANGLQRYASEREVTIRVTASPTPVWIDADPKQLGMALAALVRNGLEAAEQDGWVRIRPIHRPDRIDLIVEDSGPGLDEESLDHLFDPFYSGRSAGRGRGLGLPMAWRLAREHGGDVRYVPIPDGPTRFVLSLPIALANAGMERRTA
jgi:two-component system NtrC family sensor kinase